MPFPNTSTQFKAGNQGGPGRPRKSVVACAIAVLHEYRHRLKPDDVQQLRELVAGLGPDLSTVPAKTVQSKRPA